MIQNLGHWDLLLIPTRVSWSLSLKINIAETGHFLMIASSSADIYNKLKNLKASLGKLI